MNKLLAAVALATVIASPALAQSSDPSIGSGNVVGQTIEDNALAAHARELPQQRNDLAGRTVLPYTLQEWRAFDQAKGDIW